MELKNSDIMKQSAPKKHSITKKGFIVDVCALFILLIILCSCFFDVLTRAKTLLPYGDATQQSYAWIGKIWNATKDGRIALWDFNQYSGTSFAGEMQTAPFYIFNLFFSVFLPTYTQYAFDIYILFHFFLASCFMYALLRYNKIKWGGCLAGAIVFAYIGSVSARATAQHNIFFGLIYMPAVLLSYQVSLDEKKRHKALLFSALSGLLLGTEILAGHMQPYIHTVLALILFALCYVKKPREWGRNLLKLSFVGGSSIVFSFGQIIASFEYLKRAYRWVGLENPVRGLGKLPAEAYDIVVTRFSNLKDVVVNTYSIGDECSLFISWGGLFLAILGLVYILGFRKHRNRFSVYAIVSMVFAIIISFGRQNPIGALFTVLPGFSSVREPARALCIYNLSIAIVISKGVSFVHEAIELKLIQKGTLTSRIVSSVWILVVLAMMTISAIQFNIARKADITSTETPNYAYKKTETIDALIEMVERDKSEGVLYRYICDTIENTLTPNLGSVYNNLYGAFGHRATMPIQYYEYLGKYGWDFNGHMGEALAVKYLVSNVPLSGDQYSTFEFVGQYEDQYIYQKTDAKSMFTYVTANGEYQDLHCDSINIHCNDILLTVDMVETGKIRIAQLGYPGWKARVDGKLTKIEIDEEGFMIISLSEGRHEVRFYYQPWWFAAWAAVLAVYLILLAWSAVRLYRHGHPRQHKKRLPCRDSQG